MVIASESLLALERVTQLVQMFALERHHRTLRTNPPQRADRNSLCRVPHITPLRRVTRVQANTIDRAAAVRFLTQSTFGASQASIAELVALGSYDAWIDQQMAMPMSLTEPYTRANSNGSLRTTRHYIWWDNAMTGADQLRQRVAFALSEIFVVSDIDYVLGNSQYAMCNWYDMLADEAFGNFRDLLERVTLHAVMGTYLSMVRNERADPARNVRPDENYAREILQLFTIGLHELHPDGTLRRSGGEPIPTYNQATVEEFAKTFTGWNYADTGEWNSNRAYDRTLPMTAWQEYHDDTPKVLLNGVTLPGGQSAEQDLAGALDNIFAHPNVGPFIARSLIQRLVTSNPTPGYVGRCAAVFDNDGAGVRGNLGALVRAILVDTEARTGHLSAPATFGKVKEPLLRLTQLWRAFDAQPGPDSGGIYRTRARVVDQIIDLLGQAPLQSPSVFNFFSPDTPLGANSALVAPETQILTEINVATTDNMLFSQIYSHNSFYDAPATQTRIQITNEMALATDIDALLDHLDELLLAGSMPAQYRSVIADRLATHDASTAEGRADRVLDGIYAIVGSPFHYIQK